MTTIEILNPAPGGSWYTSERKAQEFITRGRAVMECGALRFLDAMARRPTHSGVGFWNGQPKPKILRKVNPNRIYDPDCGLVIPMHRPGEVRS